MADRPTDLAVVGGRLLTGLLDVTSDLRALDGSGTRSVMGDASSGLVPQVTMGAMVAASRCTSRSNAAPGSVGSVRHHASALSQSASFGA